MNSTERLKQEKKEIISKYVNRNNLTASNQVITTFLPYCLLFYLGLVALEMENLLLSILCLAAVMVGMWLFLIRVFMVMHDCGHMCLFTSPKVNNIVGFLCGVLNGMPAYVWSQHHNFHHANNGNWNKYRGPLAILTTEEYGKLTQEKRKKYKQQRNILLAPFAGFMYFIFNPRVNWIRGTTSLLSFMVKRKRQSPNTPLHTIAGEHESKCWDTKKEFWHMTLNNIAVLSSWVIMSQIFGALNFFTVYILAVSVSGGAGIVLFTVQHNFEDSYASGDEDWNYYTAALKGTSYLVLPEWLNWFSLDIAYHHVHHLSSRIPNYKLAEAHREYEHLFDDVRRIRLSEVKEAFEFILWDTQQEKLISIDQYDRQVAAGTTASDSSTLPDSSDLNSTAA